MVIEVPGSGGEGSPDGKRPVELGPPPCTPAAVLNVDRDCDSLCQEEFRHGVGSQFSIIPIPVIESEECLLR